MRINKKSGSDPHAGQHQSGASIKVISRIRIKVMRIRNLSTSQKNLLKNLKNYRIRICITQKVGSDPHPDLHQSDKLDPDPHQYDADPQHCQEGQNSSQEKKNVINFLLIRVLRKARNFFKRLGDVLHRGQRKKKLDTVTGT
jgi:hypothetical protein